MAGRSSALVIGGGVIGVASAYYLAQEGWEVTLLEKGEIGGGCSYGNAGLVVPSHSLPLAAPGVWKKGLSWMLRRNSPFYIKPRFDKELIAWLYRFQRACHLEKALRSLRVLRELHCASLALYEELAAFSGFEFGFRRAGMLSVYRSARGWEEAVEEARLLSDAGVRARVLEARDAMVLEPNLLSGVVGGVFFPDDAQLVPDAFVRGLASLAEAKGVRLCPSTEVKGWESAGDRVAGVRSSRGRFQADEVVLAAGSWSAGLSRELGLALPIQPAKGYSVTFEQPPTLPRLPLILGEARVAITPLADGRLRLSGTFELAGLDLSIDSRRVEAMWNASRDFLSGVPAAHEGRPAWAGLRPCTPDGLPVLGRPKRYSNLIIASGHAMIGISLGPITGRLVADLACQKPPRVPVDSLQPERFA